VLTDQTRRRFVKDFSLQIPVLTDPYFEYYLELYDPLYSTEGYYKLLVDAVNHYGGEEQFFVAGADLRDRIISHVENKPRYQAFAKNEDDFIGKMKVRDLGVRQEGIYHAGNADTLFISIDIKTANFQSLRYFDADFVDGCASYEDFVGRFTDHPAYFAKSKNLRQSIFGKLSPTRQQHINRWMLNHVLQSVIEAGIPEERLRLLGSDELIVVSSEKDFVSDWELTSTNHTGSLFRRYRDKVEGAFNLRVEPFWLRRIHPDHDFFVKEWDGATPKFRNVPVFVLPQVIKYYFGKPVEEYDLMFMHEDKVARYLNPLFENVHA